MGQSRWILQFTHREPLRMVASSTKGWGELRCKSRVTNFNLLTITYTPFAPFRLQRGEGKQRYGMPGIPLG